MVWSVLIVPTGVIENVRKCPWQSIIDFHDDQFCRQYALPSVSDSFFSSNSMDGSVENDSLIITV